jgi:hypothetical protein
MENLQHGERDRGRLSGRELVMRLREQLGTYSSYRLARDLEAIMEDVTLPEETRKQANAYKKNPRLGIDIALVDTIVARSLEKPPKGFISQHELCAFLGVSWDTLVPTLKKFIT